VPNARSVGQPEPAFDNGLDGGFARLAAVVKAARAKASASGPGHLRIGQPRIRFQQGHLPAAQAEAKFPLRKACGILERLGVDRVVIDAS
jgi:hypothetical protein